VSIQAGLRAAMLAESTITDITSNIFVTAIRQDVGLPNITIIKTNEEPNNHLGGAGDLRFADFDIECRATTEKGAVDLADAVIAAFEDFTGAMGSQTCKASLYLDSEDDHEYLNDGSIGQFVSTVYFQFQYT